jgi:hypothetical protein
MASSCWKVEMGMYTVVPLGILQTKKEHCP